MAFKRSEKKITKNDKRTNRLMTGHLPYEEQLQQQWNDLPMPDMDMAWADMKRRLEEDDNRRLIPFWLRGCAGWLLLGLLVTAVAWWIIRPEKWFKKTKSKQSTSQVTVQPNEIKPKGDSITYSKQDSNGSSIVLKPQSDSVSKNNIKPNGDTSSGKTIQPTTDPKNKPSSKGQSTITNPDTRKKNTQKNTTVKNRKVNDTNPNLSKNKEQKGKNEKGQQPSNDTLSIVKKDTIVFTDTVSKTITKKDLPDTATIAKAKSDTVSKQPEQENTEKDSAKKKNPVVFSAGLGIHQQLPIDGQKWVAYSAQGRKLGIGDYIPAPYLRLTKPGKWFVQTEFRYGAPQSVKEQLIRRDTVATTLPFPQFKVTNSSSLKKIYYHQLSLSFNYIIVKNWSVGAGIQLNKFYRAIVQQSSLYQNNFTGIDSIPVSKPIVSLHADSASEFKKSYLQAVFETQYQWKRFSFGARYTLSWQPYLKYTLQNGTEGEDKTNSLNLFLRFQLWKSKNKKAP